MGLVTHDGRIRIWLNDRHP